MNLRSGTGAEVETRDQAVGSREQEETHTMAARKKSSIRKKFSLATHTPGPNVPTRKRTIIGMGKFDGGPPDLATNERYMEGLGLSRIQPEG
jgi:hypothetical protein